MQTLDPASPAGATPGSPAAQAPQPFVIPPGPYPFVPRLPVPADTPLDACDRAVAEVRANADRWARTSPDEVARLLDEMLPATARVAARWVALASRHEGLDPAGPDSAEEGIVGPYVLLRAIRFHRDALRDIARDGVPRIPGGVRTRADGRVAARVFPGNASDRLLYLGCTAEVRLQPGITADTLDETRATAWRTPPPGRVCLVLGAGNASSIGPLDTLHKLVVERQVVVLKMHPAMAHLGEVQEAALAPFIRAGVVRVVYGDYHQGSHLAAHAGVDTLHVTGADRTYDAIVFGTGPDGLERKRRDDPILHKPFSAELGNLTPIIVVPGRWSDADLDYQAENIVTMLTNNAGFNCTTSRVIVTAASWPQRAALMDRIRARLTALPTRLAWYPGAAERFDAFGRAHPEAERFGDPGDGHLQWMLVPGLSPDAAGDPCYRVEAFCSVTAETPIDAPDTETYLARATAFANEQLWGTLNATLIADPATTRDPRLRAALGRAVEDLRYGTVSLNHWSALGFAVGSTPWGAYPGHPRNDIGSGTGFVHNPFMFEGIEKVVARAPFRAWPKPIWFSSHRTAHRVIPPLVGFEADRRPDRLLPLFWHALRG